MSAVAEAAPQWLDVDDARCALELGTWSPEAVDRLLRDAHRQSADPGARLAWIARRLQGTPFEFESKLPIPGRGQMRFRIADLDCATFVYAVLAMADARGVVDASRRLRAIRYLHDRIIDSDPEHGTIFDFTYEALIVNAVARGLVRDVTEEIGGPDGTEEITGELAPLARDAGFDPERRRATAKLDDRTVRARCLRADRLDRLDTPWLRHGDLVLLRKDSAKAPPILVHHMVVAWVDRGPARFLHATRSFAWRPDAGPEAPAEHTGRFYGDRRREQLGVAFGARHAGDEVAFTQDGLPFHGYLQDQPRALADYARTNFAGAFVLRPLGRPGDTR